MTSLHVAAKRGECIEIVKKLIQKGANIDIQDNNGVSETDPANNTVSIVHFFCCLIKFYQPYVENNIKKIASACGKTNVQTGTVSVSVEYTNTDESICTSLVFVQYESVEICRNVDSRILKSRKRN